MNKMSKEEKIQELNKIAKKVEELSKPLLEDLARNKSQTNGFDTGVDHYNNSWVVKQHNFTKHDFDFTIK